MKSDFEHVPAPDAVAKRFRLYLELLRARHRTLEVSQLAESLGYLSRSEFRDDEGTAGIPRGGVPCGAVDRREPPEFPQRLRGHASRDGLTVEGALVGQDRRLRSRAVAIRGGTVRSWLGEAIAGTGERFGRTEGCRRGGAGRSGRGCGLGPAGRAEMGEPPCLLAQGPPGSNDPSAAAGRPGAFGWVATARGDRVGERGEGRFSRRPACACGSRRRARWRCSGGLPRRRRACGGAS